MQFVTLKFQRSWKLNVLSPFTRLRIVIVFEPLIELPGGESVMSSVLLRTSVGSVGPGPRSPAPAIGIPRGSSPRSRYSRRRHSFAQAR